MKGRGFGLRPFICPRVHARGIVFLFFEKTGLYYDCIHYSGQGCRAETRRRKAKALEGIQAREPNRLGVHGAVRHLVRLRVPPAHHLGRLFQLLPSGQPRRRPLWRRRTGQRVRRIPELQYVITSANSDWCRPCAALHRHPGADHDHRRPCAGYGHRFVCRQARYRFPSGYFLPYAIPASSPPSSGSTCTTVRFPQSSRVWSPSASMSTSLPTTLSSVPWPTSRPGRSPVTTC